MNSSLGEDEVCYYNRNTMKGFLLVMILLLPQLALGADPGGLVTCTGADCNLCTFILMVGVIINWLFGFLVLAAVLVLVFAGFKLVVSAGNPSAMEDAKKMATNVVIGLVIVMSAWLIVDTMMKALLDPNLEDGSGKKFGPWNELSEGAQCGGSKIQPKN